MEVPVKAVRRWDRERRLQPARPKATGRRYGTEDPSLAVRRERKVPAGPRKVVACCQVISLSQRPDLANQRMAGEQFCLSRGLAPVECIEAVSGGLHFHRQTCWALRDVAAISEMETGIAACQNRWTRFGNAWLELGFHPHGFKLRVLNQEPLSPEPELVQDLLAIPYDRKRTGSSVVGVDGVVKTLVTLSTGEQILGPPA